MLIVSVAYMALIGDGLAREHAHLKILYLKKKEEKMMNKNKGEIMTNEKQKEITNNETIYNRMEKDSKNASIKRSK